MRSFRFVSLVSLCAWSLAFSQSLGFEELWSKVRGESLSAKANQEEIKASEFALTRTQRSWLPTLYLSSQGLVSNSPTGLFFSRLGQRGIEATDFVPDDLNSPGFGLWANANLGAQFTLYDGKTKSFAASALSHKITALGHATNAGTQSKYAQLASLYAQAISIKHKQEALDSLDRALHVWRKRYRLGSQDNPVGYSGFLGINTLDKNISALRMGSTMEKEILRSEMLKLGAELPVTWNVSHKEFKSFVTWAMPKSSSTGDSASVMQMKAYSASQKEMGESMARQFYPRVNAFVEGGGVLGDRRLGSAMTAGVMAQWNFFDPSNYRIQAEAQAMARSLELKAQDVAMQSQQSFTQSVSSIEHLFSTLRTLEETHALMDKQVKVTQNLFEHGAIPIHNVMEVFHQKLTLIGSKSDTEKAIAHNLHMALASSTNFNNSPEAKQ